jgi:spore germination protein YaaH
MKRRLFALLWLLLCVTPVGARHVVPLQPTITPDAAPSWCISVWYPSADTGGLDSIRAHAVQIDVINPFWYAPRPDGTIRPAEDEAADLLAEWRADGMKIVATIANNGDWSMIATSELRAFHVQQIVQLADEMNYDGIDIDYEGFSLASRDAFSEFIEALSAELHAHGKLLIVAVHAKTSDTGSWEAAAAQDWTRIAPAADALEIMTYDYTSRNKPPGPLGPPAWVHDVLAYAATVTDLGKVRMGLGFYAYRWLRDNPPATTTSWQDIQPLIQSFQPEILRDPSVMEARVEIKPRGLPKQTIYFADSIGIEYKVGQILSAFPTLGGVAIWGIGGEDPANWDVLRSARQTNCSL